MAKPSTPNQDLRRLCKIRMINCIYSSRQIEQEQPRKFLTSDVVNETIMLRQKFCFSRVEFYTGLLMCVKYNELVDR